MDKSVHAVILAGGKGERLKLLVDELAKPVLTYAGNTNTLSLAIGSLLGSGIGRIDVYTQYKRESVNAYIEKFWLPELDFRSQILRTIPPEKKTGYKGTADAVYHNLESIKHSTSEYVVIAAGDHASWIDYRKFFNFHKAMGADLSIVVLPVPLASAAKQLGVIETDSHNRVKSFEEKPEQPKAMPGDSDKALASAGIYFFKKSFLIEILENAVADKVKHDDFGNDIIPLALSKNAKIFAYHHNGYWRDLGSIKAYFDAHIIDLLGPNQIFNPYVNPFNPEIGIKEAHLPPAHIHNGVVTNGAMIGSGCVLERSTLEQTFLSSGVIVGRDVSLYRTIVHQGVEIGPRCHLEKVIVGHDAKVRPNTIITPGKNDYDGAYYYDHSSGVTVIV